MKLGKPVAQSHEAQLHRELRKMVREIRATLVNVDSVAKARALGRSLRKRWSDERIEEIVRRLAERAEKAASRPWKPLDKVALVEDALRRKRYSAEKIIERWVEEATKLITSVRDEVAEQLEKDIVEALEKAQTAADLQRKWTRNGIPVEFGTLEGRVKVSPSIRCRCYTPRFSASAPVLWALPSSFGGHRGTGACDHGIRS